MFVMLQAFYILQVDLKFLMEREAGEYFVPGRLGGRNDSWVNCCAQYKTNDLCWAPVLLCDVDIVKPSMLPVQLEVFILWPRRCKFLWYLRIESAGPMS